MEHSRFQHIGIVACSAEGAALCYRTICVEGAKRFGGYRHPEVTVHTAPLQDYIERIERDDWAAVADIMLDSAHKLARVGARFLICPDNTLHQALPRVEPRSPLPWLHIADAVAGEAVARGFRRVGLTGTRWLVDSEVYPDRLGSRGISVARPSDAERSEVHRIIMDELVHGVFHPQGAAYLRQVIEHLRAHSCDAVVLGCTELPLVIDDTSSPLPTLDSTRLLARAALRRATG
jgi:aspartate racemase